MPYRDILLNRVLPRVQAPGQYIGGEWNSFVKDHAAVRGKLCLACPEPYTVGMSNHGLQVLYALMNARPDWACERAFTPAADLETLLREHELPLVSLETFTPLRQFDIVSFLLQDGLSATNLLTMLDAGGIPIAAEARTLDDPLVIAGGPVAGNPEPLVQFIDAFVVGDGEEALPQVCDLWLEVRRSCGDRAAALLEMAAALPFLYVPRFYEPLHSRVPERIVPAMVADLDAVPLPAAPIVPWIECIHERIAIEIARGCPPQCRFRRMKTIVAAAEAAYRATGFREVALLGQSASDYPEIEELLARLHTIFRPLGVRITMPGLPIDANWQAIADLLDIDRREGLALAPEAGREELRRAIGTSISNDDLLDACRRAMERGFFRVKLRFTCGLPGEEPADLDAIVELAESISRLGNQVRGHPATVVADVAHFIPKPHTPFERSPMQTVDYFEEAHERMRKRKRMRSVALCLADAESTLIEAALCRGDRRLGQAIEFAWRRGARQDGSSERMRPWLWHESFVAAGIDLHQLLHLPCPSAAALPWGISRSDRIGRRGAGNVAHRSEEPKEGVERISFIGAPRVPPRTAAA